MFLSICKSTRSFLGFETNDYDHDGGCNYDGPHHHCYTDDYVSLRKERKESGRSDFSNIELYSLAMRTRIEGIRMTTVPVAYSTPSITETYLICAGTAPRP